MSTAYRPRESATFRSNKVRLPAVNVGQSYFDESSWCGCWRKPFGSFRRPLKTALLSSLGVIILLLAVHYAVVFGDYWKNVETALQLPASKLSNIEVTNSQPVDNPSRETDSALDTHLEERQRSSTGSLTEQIQRHATRINISVDAFDERYFSALNEVVHLSFRGEMDIYWKSREPLPLSRGLVFLFHNCKYNGQEWWSPLRDRFSSISSSHFHARYSLPSENRMTSAFLEAGYWVVALTPVRNKYKNGCWAKEDRVYLPFIADYLQTLRQLYSPTAPTAFDKQVSRAISKLLFKETQRQPTSRNRSSDKLPLLPVFGVGIANGGVFLNNYLLYWLDPMSAATSESKKMSIRYEISDTTSRIEAQPLRFSAIVLMNAGIWHHDYDKPPRGLQELARKLPPVLFIDHTRNGEVAWHNTLTVKLLNDVYVRWQEMESNDTTTASEDSRGEAHSGHQKHAVEGGIRRTYRDSNYKTGDNRFLSGSSPDDEENTTLDFARQLLSDPRPLYPAFFRDHLASILPVGNQSSHHQAESRGSHAPLFTLDDSKKLYYTLYFGDVLDASEITALDAAIASQNASHIQHVERQITLAHHHEGVEPFIWPGSGVLFKDVAGHIYLPRIIKLWKRALPTFFSERDMLLDSDPGQKGGDGGLHSPLLQALRQAWGLREINDEFLPQVSLFNSIAR